MIGISAGFFCWDFFWYFVVSWLPSYLVDVRHVTLPHLALFGALPFVVFAAAEALGGAAAGMLIGRGANVSTVTKGLVAAGFALGLLISPAALGESSAWSIGFLLAAPLSGIACANMLAIPRMRAPSDQVALWTGVMNCVGNIGGVLAPAITGLVVARTGSYVPAFLTVSVILILGIAAYTLVVPPLAASGDPADR